MQFEPWPESETICFTDKDNVYTTPWKMSGKDIPYIGWSIRGGTLETQLNFPIVEPDLDPVRSRASDSLDYLRNQKFAHDISYQ